VDPGDRRDDLRALGSGERGRRRRGAIGAGFGKPGAVARARPPSASLRSPEDDAASERRGAPARSGRSLPGDVVRGARPRGPRRR
jgi:hypothetical protein